MSTPNPLVPEGSLQQSKGKSNVKIAVFAILAVHAVFLGGLLMLGCKEKPKPADTAAMEGTTNSLETASANPSAMPVDPSVTQPGQTPSGVPALPTPGATAPVANPGAQAPVGLTGSAPVSGSSVVAAPAPTPTPDPVGITPSGSATEHVIASGETLGKIAKDNHISVKALLEANPNVNPTKLQIGQKIQVPAAGASSSASVAKADAAATTDSAAEGVYVVKAGDMLERIAKNHGTSVKAIKLANNLKTDRLKVGQKLKMPAAKATASVEAPIAPASPLATTTITPSTTVASATH